MVKGDSSSSDERLERRAISLLVNSRGCAAQHAFLIVGSKLEKHTLRPLLLPTLEQLATVV